MIKSYLNIAIRNLLKNKTYSLINILGLAIGLACSIMVLLFLKNELTYDKMHSDRSDIYRVGFKLDMPNGSVNSAVITAAVAPSILEEFPEVKSMVRVRYPAEGFFTYNDKNYSTEQVSFADSTFFNFFSFKLISGTANAVLNDNYSVVLTESLANKIFGDEDPIGKVLNWNNTYSVIVKGIAADCPENSSIQFSALISFSTIYDQGKMYMDWNGANQFYNYIKLNSEASIESMIPKLPDFLEKHINYKYRQSGWLMNLLFDRLDRMHLYGSAKTSTSGDPRKIRNVSIIGLFVLLIAVFNFINLSTAQSGKRSVEIGVRKVLGADRFKLRRQFLSEAVVFSLFSFVISLILIEIFQPQFSQMIGDYELYTSSNVSFILGIVLFTIIVGVLSGLYPAYFIANFNPIKSLKGMSLGKGGKPYLRNTLVILQFVISTTITTYTLVMIMQMMFFQNRDLGFESDRTLILRLPSENAISSYPVFKTKLMQIADIDLVASSSDLIGVHVGQNGYLPEGLSSVKLINFCSIDESLIDLLDLEIVNGRGFSSSYALDDTAYIINETMAKEMNWDEPLGKKISRNGLHPVIGVVKDFHFQNVSEEIKPLIFGFTKKYRQAFVYIKLRNEDYQKALINIEDVWRQVLPNEPFNYEFYSNHLKENYAQIRKSIKITGVYALFAIIIACMGLYGLAMFTVERRKREIGIRKVFGAEAAQISKLIIFDFLKWIVVANMISIPITYYLSMSFLEKYPYAMKLNLLPFVITLMVSLSISLITVIVQIVKLTRINPVDTLKCE